MTVRQPAVLGVDASLTATGLALVDGTTTTVDPGKRRELERLAFIRDAVAEAMVPAELVVLEGYAYSRSARAHSMGELGGALKLLAYELGMPLLIVPPNLLKKYACGNGIAGKAEVISNARERLMFQSYDDNQADALWLRAMGLDLLGFPPAKLPLTHKVALAPLENDPAVKRRPTWA